MALDSTFQTPLAVNTLYKVTATSEFGGQIAPNLEVIGTVSIYGSQNLPLTNGAVDTTKMVQISSSFSGYDAFGVIPNYLYFTGAASSIIASGLQILKTNPTT